MDLQTSILVVDDEPHSRQSPALILGGEGYRIITVRCCEEAFRCLQANPYDLILLGLDSSGIPVVDLLSRIQQICPDMPILILSAQTNLEVAVEILRNGASDYLLKPVEPQQLVYRVKQILAASQQNRRRREIMLGLETLLTELTSLEKGLPSKLKSIDKGSTRETERYLQKGVFWLDTHTRQVTIRGENLSLSPTAFEYLLVLLKRSPEAVSCEELVRVAQRYNLRKVEAQEMVRWRIHELRKIIEKDLRRPQYIITVRGAGYRLLTS